MSLQDRRHSVDDIAAYLGVSKHSVYTWLTAKRTPGHKVGRFWKFKRDQVDEWMRTGGVAMTDRNEGSAKA